MACRKSKVSANPRVQIRSCISSTFTRFGTLRNMNVVVPFATGCGEEGGRPSALTCCTKGSLRGCCWNSGDERPGKDEAVMLAVDQVSTLARVACQWLVAVL